MGNGASARVGSAIIVDGDKIEVARLKLLYPELRCELKKKEEVISEKDKQLSLYEVENTNLKKEIRQLKSVLEATVVKTKRNDVIDENEELDINANGLNKLKFKKVVSQVRNKRFAVSAESGRNSDSQNIDLKKIPKSSDCKKLIEKAILKNNFLKHLEEAQIKEIVLCMDLKKFRRGDDVIKEGDSGSALFVLHKGLLEVRQGDKILGKPMGPGILFGELAILYNCTRTATVKALEDVEVWSIERRIFQAVMKRTGTMRRDEHCLFLKSVPIFDGFQTDKLYKIVEVAADEFYHENEYIIREGERGDSFFIIMGGSVKVLQLIEGKEEPQEIRQLKAGDYFGEKALLIEDLRTASIVANEGGTDCLVIERENFLSFIGDLKQIREKDYGDEARKAVALSRSSSAFEQLAKTIDQIRPEFKNKSLNSYKLVATLGMGGFGRVELVHDKEDTACTFALKCLVKKHVVETKQQEHVFNEKRILISLDSPFIVKLYQTFKDTRYVYLLMEVCLGGELWTILRDKDHFGEPMARFYIACVVEALEYLHKRGIVYRDLKPENLLMDNIGYVKLVDFGFAKKIENGSKTWTFCGTPEYVAPEIILNKGHDCSADCWSLGILIYELMTGNPPFTSSDPMNTYNIILRGIDVLEFSTLVTRNAQNLIKKLCKENPMERLGNQKDGFMDVRKHKWFQGFHWSGIKNRTLKPPIHPKIKGPLDNSNFDYFSPSRDVPPEEHSGWDKDF